MVVVVVVVVVVVAIDPALLVNTLAFFYVCLKRKEYQYHAVIQIYDGTIVICLCLMIYLPNFSIV